MAPHCLHPTTNRSIDPIPRLVCAPVTTRLAESRSCAIGGSPCGVHVILASAAGSAPKAVPVTSFKVGRCVSLGCLREHLLRPSCPVRCSGDLRRGRHTVAH